MEDYLKVEDQLFDLFIEKFHCEEKILQGHEAK